MTKAQSAECVSVLEELSAYLDGEVDVTACEAIEAHCQHCPDCQRAVSGLRQATGLCKQAAAEALPEAVRTKARARIAQLLDNARLGQSEEEQE